MPYEGVMTLLKGIRDGARTLLEFQKPSRQDHASSTLAQAGSLPVPLQTAGQRTTANSTWKPKLPPVPAPPSGAPPPPPPKSAKEAKENEKCTIS